MIGRRWVARGAAGVCALAAGLGVGVALAGSGGLDPSFGTSGTTVLERPTSTYPTPTALAPGGKIVVVATSEGVIRVSRLLPSGAPDPTFDGGVPAVIESAGVPSAYALAVQPDGKIILVGWKNTGPETAEGMVWRLKADGGSGGPGSALDPTFGTEGTAAIKTPFTYTILDAVAIRPDGKIIVAGRGFSGKLVAYSVGVWRLTAGGMLDTGFEPNGAAEISDGHGDSADAIALQPGGKIVVAGTSEVVAGHRDAVVWRVKADGGPGPNGVLDTTFNTNGQANIDSGTDDAVTGVALQPDSKIVLGGRTESTPGHYHAMVWRVKADGGSGATNDALDTTFGNSGAATIDGGGFAYAGAVALQPDGKILLAGSARVGANPSAAVIWRLVGNGGTGAVNSALDATFGTGGAATVSVGSGAEAGALALQPDRRILAAGATFNEKLLLFRALGDPFAVSVVKAGSGSGSVQSSPPGINCGAVCSGLFDDGAGVTLIATPGRGSAFAGWSGAGCSGAGTCALTMSADQTVTATFNTLPPLLPLPAPTKATISALRESNSTFTVGPSSTPLTGQASAKRHRRGTVYSFQLDQAATVRIAIRTTARGRRLDRSCRADSRRLRHKPRCTRTITIATLTRSAHPGLNKVPFSGRVNGKALTPGRYQATFTAVDGAGASPPKTLSFTIVRR